MEEQYAAAIAYYNNATQEFRSSAESFFQSMATHGANQISYAVFNDFIIRKDYNWIINDQHLFQKLDGNRDGSLDFWEMLTFYYIINTRYFHCRECQVCLSGLYFTCVACFEGGAHYHHHRHHCDPGTYNLCAACYRSRNFTHYPQHTYFLDNHILLRSKRGRPPYAAPHLVSAPKPIVVYHNTYNIVYNNLPSQQPVPPKKNWLSIFYLLELAIASAALASSCSIM